MSAYLRRLVRTGAAYQANDVVAKVLALALLPLYTRYLSTADYGTVDLLMTLVILVSLVVRLGLVEAFVRFYFTDEDVARRDRLARTTTGAVFVTTTVVAVPCLVFAAPLSELILGRRDGVLMAVAIIGLWIWTNLDMANALLRVDERAKTYLVISLINVGLTVALSVTLVVGFDEGARGLLIGNFTGSALALLVIWFIERARLGVEIDRAQLRPLLRFGVPTVPAEVSVFALNFIDRIYLYRVQSASAAGLYSLAVKLAAVIITVVRAFQYAWPPLAYSIQRDEEARRIYAVVTTYYVLLTGFVVAGLTLEGRWILRVFAAPDFFDAHEALPWVALGWAMYGLFLVFVVMAGRSNVTTRNAPAALAGLVVNAVLLVVLVDPLGIAGAGIALCGAYAVILVLMYAFTRRLFAVDFEWGRLAHLVAVIGGITVAGELLLPESGAAGFLARLAAVALIPAALLATGFFSAAELRRIRALPRLLRARGGGAPPPAAEEV